MKKLIKSQLFLQVIVASMVATLATAGIVAATTIGTNISTGGTLDVTGASTLTGNTAVTGTLGVTGKTTLVNASSTLLSISGQTWLNDNATVAAGKGLILGTSATAITGSAGMIYYDSASKIIKMHDGTSWFTVGTSTSGISLSGSKLQLADLSYYATIGTTTQQGLSVLTLEATSTAAIPLSIVARSSQTANLLQIMDSGSTNLLTVSSGGNLAVDTNTLLVNASSNRVGIGTTTPFASLSINNTAGENALVIGSSTATWLKVDESGLLTVAKGATFSDTLALTGNLTVDTQTLFVGASTNRVGIGTTTPFASLSINNTAGENALVIGSSTATWLQVDSSGLLTVAKAATFSSTLAAGNTVITGILSASSKIGAASTTPTFQLGVGTGQATSTISMGKFCMYAEQENGVGTYLRLGSNQPANQPFATSSIPCNQ